MTKDQEVDCDHLIPVDFLKQCVLVFSDFDRARAELEPYGAVVSCGVGGAGYAVNNKDGSGLFWMVFSEKKPAIETIVHECIHVVDYLCEFAGIPVSVECSEVRCYLVEWLVVEVLKRYGMKVKYK